jgi:hypothetical protein
VIWAVAAAAFVLGFAVGWAIDRWATSLLIPSPAGKRLLDCMAACAGEHAFGSPEFDSCVAACAAQKKS